MLANTGSTNQVWQTAKTIALDWPWVNRLDDGTLNAITGPERLVLRTPAALRGEDLKTLGEFAVAVGQCVPFVLSHGVSDAEQPIA